VNRNFAQAALDRLWVADLTYMTTWSGWVCVAFVDDAYARRILGWRCGSSMSTQLVLDALENAVWTRQRVGASLSSVVPIPTAGQPAGRWAAEHRASGTDLVGWSDRSRRVGESG